MPNRLPRPINAQVHARDTFVAPFELCTRDRRVGFEQQEQIDQPEPMIQDHAEQAPIEEAPRG